MKVVDYYDSVTTFVELQDINEWVILQNLLRLESGDDWIDRAIVYIESIQWEDQGKPQINMEGYEFVNLLEHFEYGTPIDGGEELLKRMSRALERGDLHYELSQGQLGIDLNNVVVANEIEIDWTSVDSSSYIWNNDGWRIKRLNDPRMLPFMCSINYRLIL